MKYEITTKQDKKYTVSDENAWLWVEIERELGYTVSQAAEKMSQGSLDVITCMLFKAAKAQATSRKCQTSKHGSLMSSRLLRWSRTTQKTAKGHAGSDSSIDRHTFSRLDAMVARRH
jgi:hypothetical protein